MKSKLDNMGPHEKVKMYMLLWVLIGLSFVLFFSFVGTGDGLTECLDGTLVEHGADCPQCLDDSHCNADQNCRGGRCAGKICIDDNDCVVQGNECVFGTCRNIGGGSVTVFDDD